MHKHYRMLLPILIDASPILIHASPILIHALPILDSAFGSRLHILIHASPILDSAFGSQLHILVHCRHGSQSESSITQPVSSLHHPGSLGSGGRPFSALGSSRLTIAYLIT